MSAGRRLAAFKCVTMSLHKLTAGSGYDYLTRQIAAMDSTEKGRTSLASYYTEKGETPGRWIGSGLAGLDGLKVGDAVKAEQMQALFGSGFHPLADERLAAVGPEPSEAEVKVARRLGTPFKTYFPDVPPFQVEVARRVEELNVASGHPRSSDVGISERARVRTEVAREFFFREHGREPADARELAAAVARFSRPRTTAIAGFDLTFSPVKSVSTLWALADPPVAAMIERAHASAVRDALRFIERDALFTRRGTNGVQQVDVTGLVAAAFTHRDSRAGEPDLHTHVAVANKVQTLDGRWLAIDGRMLFKSKVTASETYNTALERHLNVALGLRFAERPEVDRRKIPVREVVGVEPVLNDRWSSRRASIDIRRSELATQFQRRHGRPPTPVEAIKLAQRATLETRDAKHEPRTVAVQRREWRSQAAETLGDAMAVDRMVADALRPCADAGAKVTDAWIDARAAAVVSQVGQRRATWQVWHLRSEAHRQARSANVSPDGVDSLVSRIVAAAVERCVALATDGDPIVDPQPLRRIDGSSVYHVAGADLFTSQAILDAEQRIVAAAGRREGRRIADATVNLALLESSTKGVELNAGQAAMVRQMVTSGTCVQLGIAAAGTGKTTAMSVLTRAWEDSGGNVVGLAPSAAAASVLRDQTGASTDTLAKLIHAIQGDPERIPGSIGADTLVLIDEAGMADTLSLDVAISYALERGASVRLIGDHQQLSAIGSGGVLRDIATQHGAIRLSEMLRFADPAEGAATLALRDGLPESLGFYLDNDRVHVGDLATLTDEVFNGWQDDRRQGRDAIMLAPTRDLVQALNARARDARLTAGNTSDGPSVRLADGNRASAGDVVITRQNDRRLSVSATDWIKNGDRWRVVDVQADRLTVTHTVSGRRTTLPAPYVAEHTELGYATTVHTAQGVSADTMHGLAVGTESRQQLYTMLTRGRHANHVYLVTASDGDPHTLIRPETIHPQTPTDILEQILVRDDSAVSATTLAEQSLNAATQLGHAAARYLDALFVGAETLIGPDRVTKLENRADHLTPGISDEPAWPALRAHLILIEAQGRDARSVLASAVAARDLDGVQDRAAILDWRLDPTGLRDASPGPLPWMPAVPVALAAHPTWGPYLTQRAARVEDLAAVVRHDAARSDPPAWARQGGARPDDALLADVTVWRAAAAVDPTDPRPTGPRQLQKAAASYQRHLDERLNADRAPALSEWGPIIDALHPRRDAFTPVLAERLAAISRAGVDAAALFHAAAQDGPLPDDHVTAAMWWRISRHLSPAVAADTTHTDAPISAPWSDLLIDTLGAETAGQVTGSPWWPTLVATIDHATARGWTLTDLLDIAITLDGDDVDVTQAMIWKITLITDPAPEPDGYLFDPPPDDLDQARAIDELKPDDDEFGRIALAHDLLGPLEPTDAHIARLLDRADAWDHSPVTGDRILDINEMTATYFENQLVSSWAHSYLQTRLAQDLAGDARFRPGYAPRGWTNLVNHLRRHGVDDDEMIAAGVAKVASTGRLIDRFRDRAILPVIADHQVLGFVGRRHPDAAAGSRPGPKYLNTADTVVFHKGAQMYGIANPMMADGAIPVIVEGPLDAIAVTVATAGAYVGVAPLGTSMTTEQAAQLARLGRDPIVATDGDLAGRLAAERDYWLLTPHRLKPRYAIFEEGTDPAGLLVEHGPTPLRAALYEADSLAETLLNERIGNIYDLDVQIGEIAAVITAMPSVQWPQMTALAADKLGIAETTLRTTVMSVGEHWITDPRRFCSDQLAQVSIVRERLEHAAHARPADRWMPLARRLDARLTTQPDWSITAEMLQDVHDAGHDVPTVANQLVAHTPLGDAPAQDLRYRLVSYLPTDGSRPPSATTPPHAVKPVGDRRGIDSPAPNRIAGYRR